MNNAHQRGLKEACAIALEYAAELALMQADAIRIHVREKIDKTDARFALRVRRDTAEQIARAIGARIDARAAPRSDDGGR